MSDLGINGYNKVSPSFGQGKKDDSYERWCSEYKSFMKTFGDQLEARPELYDTQLYLLQNMQRLAKAEGKQKEAAELEAKIIAVQVAVPKPQPAPQKVSAQQVLAMQQGTPKKPAPASEQSGGVAPTAEEVGGNADEWIDGWADGTSDDGIAAPGKKSEPKAAASDNTGNSDVVPARKKQAYPGPVGKKPEITGVDIVDADIPETRHSAKKKVAPPFRPNASVNSQQLSGGYPAQNGRSVYPQQANPVQGGYPQQPNPGRGGYPQQPLPRTSLYPQQQEPGSSYQHPVYPQQQNAPLNGYPQQGGYPQQVVSGYLGYPQQAAPDQTLYPQPQAPVSQKKPPVTQKSADVQQPAETQKPAVAQKPADVQQPAEAQKPAVAQKPADVRQPAADEPESEYSLSEGAVISGSMPVDSVTATKLNLNPDVPYEETVMADSAEVLQKRGGFGDQAAGEILSAIIPEEAGMQAGKASTTIYDIATLRAALTGEPGKRSHFTSVCTADFRSPITMSKKDAETVNREFVELLAGSTSDYIDREDLRRGLKTPEDIKQRTIENKLNENNAIKARIAKAEDEIVVKFVKKYKRPDGTLNPNAYGVITSLRNKGLVPDTSLLQFTEACMKKDGTADVRKVNAIVELKQAGALTDEVLPILDMIPRDDKGVFDKKMLQDAVDLTKGQIGMPELGELLPQVAEKPAVKNAIAKISPYYPHQKAQLQELIPMMLDTEGKEDENAAAIVTDMALNTFPATQKLFAEKSDDMKIQQANIDNVREMTEKVLTAAREKGSPNISSIASDLVSSMLENGNNHREIAETLVICKDNEGKINATFASIASSLVEIGVEPGKIGKHLDRFTYKDGSVDETRAQAEAESLQKSTAALRDTNAQIKKLQETADEIRQNLQRRFN